METTPRQSPRQDASQYARLCYSRERTAKKNETTRKVNYHEHEHTHYRFARTHPHIAFRGQHSSISVHNGRRQSQS